MRGSARRENLATALEIVKQLRTLGYEIPDEAVRDGLAKLCGKADLPALERIGFIIDGAHNEDAAIKLRTSIERYFKGKESSLLWEYFRIRRYEKDYKVSCALWQRRFTP